ncbi:MAG: hypothetical protein Q9220_007289 [cf. Caloplaca sp. 1 TL-2023]
MVSGEMGNIILPGDDTGGRRLDLVYGIDFGVISISKAPFLLMAFLPSILIILCIIMLGLVLDSHEISQYGKLLAKGYKEFKFTVHGKKSSRTHRQLQREDEDWMPKPGFNSLVVAIACQPSARAKNISSDECGDVSRSRLKWGVIEDPNPRPEGRILDTRGGSVSARDYWARRQEALFRGHRRGSQDLWALAADERYRWEKETWLQDTEKGTDIPDEVDREKQAGHCGLSSGRVGAVQPMALYTGLGGGVHPRWKDS